MENEKIFFELYKTFCLCQDTGNLTDEGFKYLIEKLEKIFKKSIDI